MNESEARRRVALRAAGRCELCRGTDSLTFAHRRSRGQGGGWSPANGLRLCGSGTTGCHGWTEHNPDAAAAGGWRLVHDDRDPAVVPVWLNGLNGPGWWLLDDLGLLTWQWHEDLGVPKIPLLLPPNVPLKGLV